MLEFSLYVRNIPRPAESLAGALMTNAAHGRIAGTVLDSCPVCLSVTLVRQLLPPPCRRAEQALANQPTNDLRTDDRAATTERSVA